jgi:hypothetical protein
MCCLRPGHPAGALVLCENSTSPEVLRVRTFLDAAESTTGLPCSNATMRFATRACAWITIESRQQSTIMRVALLFRIDILPLRSRVLSEVGRTRFRSARFLYGVHFEQLGRQELDPHAGTARPLGVPDDAAPLALLTSDDSACNGCFATATVPRSLALPLPEIDAIHCLVSRFLPRRRLPRDLRAARPYGRAKCACTAPQNASSGRSVSTFNADPRRLQPFPPTPSGHPDRVATMRAVVFRDQRTTAAKSTLAERDSLVRPFPKAVLLIGVHVVSAAPPPGARSRRAMHGCGKRRTLCIEHIARIQNRWRPERIRRTTLLISGALAGVGRRPSSTRDNAHSAFS